MKISLKDNESRELPSWAEPASLWGDEERARVAHSAGKGTEARDWFDLSTELSQREADWAAGLSSDAEFIIQFRKRIDAVQPSFSAIFHAGWRAISALSGVGVALLALLFVLGQGSKEEHARGDSQQIAESVLPAEDIEFLAPVALEEAGETLSADTLAAEFGVTELMTELEAPQTETVTTAELLSLDEPVLAAVMDELEGTRFF